MGFVWRQWEWRVAVRCLAWLVAWRCVLPTRHWKEESSVPSCTGADRWTLLPRCLRSEGPWAFLAWQVCRGNFNRQVTGYVSADGKTLVLFTQVTPVADTIILHLGDGEARVRVAAVRYSKGSIPLHW